MSQVTTHVLDTALGRPAAGVAVTLEQDGTVVARGTTDTDGRVGDLGHRRERPLRSDGGGRLGCRRSRGSRDGG